MTIQPLPPSTTRILGSCQALTSPPSLVKELIDNAIDANATSIDVIISANTVDKIEVRDNGHGIAQEDLGLLGRRGHTSKLKDFEELRTIGSSSLGFRGEALASCVSLGDVTITTRTEGEPVAFMVTLNATGGFSSQLSVPHPIGTTVCVSNFLSNFPVRRQTSMNIALKSLSKIRGILQSYALARLRIRLSLKVIKTSRGSWSYVPHPKGDIKDAVTQVVGKEVANQCIEMASSCDSIPSLVYNTSENDVPISRITNNEPQSTAKLPLRIHAFLLRPDSSFSKLKGGQYASIDSRPVSCTRGFLKRIISSYKQYIRAAISNTGNDMPKDPFIYFNITCPVGSYDPNIEPAKDDVLFEDEDAVLSVADKLFKSVYSINNVPKEDALIGQTLSKQDISRNFVIHSCVEPSEIGCVSSFGAPETQYQTRDKQTRENITLKGLINEAPSGILGIANAHDCELPSSPRVLEYSDGNTLNPWTIAKLNVSATASRPHSANLPTLIKPKEQIFPVDDTPSVFHDELSIPANTLNCLAGTRIVERLRGSSPTQSSIEAWMNKQRAHATSALSEQFPRSHQTLDISGVASPSNGNHRPSHSNGFVSARSIPIEVPWSPPPTEVRPQKKPFGKFNTPFIRPKRSSLPSGTCQDASYSDFLAPFHSAFSTPLKKISRVDNSSLQDNVDAALEFERSKTMSTSRLREETAASLRVEAKTMEAQTEEISIREEFVETTLPDSGPRAYLMRSQRSKTGYLNDSLQRPKLNRVKTMLLPLETISKTFGTRELVLRMPVEAASVGRKVHFLSAFDDYTKSGHRTESLRMTESCSRQVEVALNKLLAGI